MIILLQLLEYIANLDQQLLTILRKFNTILSAVGVSAA